MSKAIKFTINLPNEAEISEHLSCCDDNFVPPLSSRVEIVSYAKKIETLAMRFEARAGSKLIGLVAVYCNDKTKGISYITSASVLREWMNQGIALCLIQQCAEYAKAIGMRQIELEVALENRPDIKLYAKSGFVATEANTPLVPMRLLLACEGEHEEQA